MNKDAVLLPTYNEKENIQFMIKEIFRIVPDIWVKVIDDNSPDGTAQTVKDMLSIYPRLSLLERKVKTGLGDAYKAAMKEVIKDKEVRSVITMDADGSHSPVYLQEMLKNLDNADLIIGSRYVNGGGVENWEWWRKNLSKSGNLYARILSGLPVNDITTGFMCIRRELLEKLNFESIHATGYSFLIEFKYNLIRVLGARVKENPIIFLQRRGGKTKFSMQIFFEGLKVPWRLFFKRLKVKFSTGL